MSKEINVANYFLAVQDQNKPYLTHIHIQKLCAYAQAFSLALLDRPLFEEDIEAWPYGPVMQSLYKNYKKYEDGVIPLEKSLSEEAAREFFDDKQKFILELTCTYCNFDRSWDLCSQSHKDFPGTFEKGKRLMTKDEIKECFSKKTLIKELKKESLKVPYQTTNTSVITLMDIKNVLGI